MSDEKIAQLLEQIGAKLGGKPQVTQSTWTQSAPAGINGIAGVAIPINVRTPIGNVRVYLTFPPDAAASPDALNALIQRLVELGLPIDTQREREFGWNGNGHGGGWQGGGGFRGGYGGGYGRPWQQRGW